MADAKISALTDGGGLKAGDAIAVARSATSFRASPIGVPVLVYRYTVAGADKASIDTGVDTADAGSNDWTSGDLLEIFMSLRTDDAAALANVNGRFNNDSGANYDRENLRAANTTLSGGPGLAETSLVMTTHGTGGSASYPGQITIVVPNFAGTTFFKTGSALMFMPDGTAANNRNDLNAIAYRSTSAITRFSIAAGAGQKLKIGSQLLIYKRLAS